MLWGVLLLIAVVMAVHAWDYRTDVQEYSFAQPATLDRHDDLSRLLQEKIPLAVEIGPLPWRPEIAEKAMGWRVVTVDNSVVSAAEWMTATGPLQNQEGLAEQIELTTGLADLDAGRPWWWLPELRECRVDLLQNNAIIPLTWVTAERQWIGCTSGGPVTVWLAHGRYRRFINGAINPWTATVAEVPWWGRVQFVEVTVKPGWCLGVPAHWGFAVSAGASNAWIWMAAQHSLASLSFSRMSA